jgi:hypothetical protein
VRGLTKVGSNGFSRYVTPEFRNVGREKKVGNEDFIPPQSLTPNLSRISSNRHHLVMDDCSKLAPTKAVNQRKWMLTKTASIRLMRTNEPATALTILFFMADDFD